jgi:DNA polymerase-4
VFLEANFGKAGGFYFSICRGIDERPVRAERIRQSVGAENTFATDLTEFGPMAAELQPLIDKVWRHCESTGNRGRTVTLKIKFADFEIISRSRSLSDPVGSRPELERVAIGLLRKTDSDAESGPLARRINICAANRRRPVRCDPDEAGALTA